MRVLLILCLLVSPLASAKVYMCVDPATGKTSFTDKGCEATASREEVKIPPANANSGSRSNSGESSKNKTWLSDRDTRKTGRDYSAQKRTMAEIAAPPATGGDVPGGGI